MASGIQTYLNFFLAKISSIIFSVISTDLVKTIPQGRSFKFSVSSTEDVTFTTRIKKILKEIANV